jgi:hypothetical protein
MMVCVKTAVGMSMNSGPQAPPLPLATSTLLACPELSLCGTGGVVEGMVLCPVLHCLTVIAKVEAGVCKSLGLPLCHLLVACHALRRCGQGVQWNT